MIDYNRKAKREVYKLRDRLVLDDETEIVLGMLEDSFKAFYRISIEIEKVMSVDNMDSKKMKELISTRNSIDKTIALWFDRLEWKESENSKMEELIYGC